MAAKTEAAQETEPATGVEVQPDQDAVALAMSAHAETEKAEQAADRKAKTATKPVAAKPAAKKPAAKKPAPKAKTTRAIVPFDEVNALLKELGLTKTQAAQATGKGTSTWAEYTGAGRKTGLNAERWPEVQKQLRAFAKSSKPK